MNSMTSNYDEAPKRVDSRIYTCILRVYGVVGIPILDALMKGGSR